MGKSGHTRTGYLGERPSEPLSVGPVAVFHCGTAASGCPSVHVRTVSWEDHAMPGTDRTHRAIADVEAHVRTFFAGHDVEALDYDLGEGRREAVPGLRIIAVSPGPRTNSWTYVTAGCWAAVEHSGHGLEFVLSTPVHDSSFAALLAMVAYYHAGHHLDIEHSMPIGGPWMPNSACDHLLVSLPYLHGPDLEQCSLRDGHARLLWVLPVTAAEIAYRRENGHEALEVLFDEAEINPTDPHRPSVV